MTTSDERGGKAVRVSTRTGAATGVESSGAGDDVEPRRINGTFPRSHLFRFICDHPIAIAAAVATTVAIGPARLVRWGSRGAQLMQRHAPAAAPLILQVARARRVRPPISD